MISTYAVHLRFLIGIKFIIPHGPREIFRQDIFSIMLKAIRVEWSTVLIARTPHRLIYVSKARSAMFVMAIAVLILKLGCRSRGYPTTKICVRRVSFKALGLACLTLPFAAKPCPTMANQAARLDRCRLRRLTARQRCHLNVQAGATRLAPRPAAAAQAPAERTA